MRQIFTLWSIRRAHVRVSGTSSHWSAGSHFEQPDVVYSKGYDITEGHMFSRLEQKTSSNTDSSEVMPLRKPRP